MGDGFAVFASKSGADTNPDWYHNLRAHPDVRIEVGADTLDVTARVLAADYETKTERVIPVVMLDPR